MTHIQSQCQKISQTYNLNIDFTDKMWKTIFKNTIDESYKNKYQNITKTFNRDLTDEMNWNNSKEFLKMVDWHLICNNTPLSESFIREFKNKVSWYFISQSQKLSESFIREFQDYVDWNNISKHQKLSEPFIREFKNKVNWCFISKYQKLSESFIREFQDYIDWDYISTYQKLSKKFIKNNKLNIDKDNWNYWTIEQKLPIISKYYEILEDTEGLYIEAFKIVRNDIHSIYNFQYQYNINETYECHCDCTNDENSFGLSALTEKIIKDLDVGLIIKVKIYVQNIGRILPAMGKIRCSKFKVIS
jgi:hypothetical protein